MYVLPLKRIVAEIDSDLVTLATEILSGSVDIGPNNTLQVLIPPDLHNFETASTFFIVTKLDGQILLRSPNLNGFEGYLDRNTLHKQQGYYYSRTRHQDVQLRVLTIPMINESGSEIIGHMQVARLMDTVEVFNRFLGVSLLVGFAAATASLLLAVSLTAGSFRPLEDIANVTSQITDADDLSRRVPDAERTDEIGVLARAINQTFERLEQLFKTQQRLMADVSHELRTPLTTIRGNIDLMRRMGNGDPESLDIIQDEAERMTRLVGDLLLLARADSGELPLAKKPVELDTVFFEVYRQSRLLSKSVEISTTAVEQVLVMGDVDRLKQLLLNLVGNAIKYTPSGGKVMISLAKEKTLAEGETAIIRITDTGVGIPADDVPFIFDRFYRVDKARSREQGGSGLGLSIAKWIATAHGGDLEVTSRLGEGSTFIITLPAMQNVITPAPLIEAIPESRYGLRRSLSATLRWRRGDTAKPEAENPIE